MPKPLSRRKIWLFRITLLLLPFVLLGVLETGLRLGGYGFDPHFFKRITIGNQPWFVQNDDFSFRFFPRNNARNPGALRMPAVKPPGTIRIFVFGESAAMGDPEPAYGPARYLEIQLREKFPDTKFEVVNTAFTAINSHVILPIARECARHDGDIWIIYMGNNEMVGPFGAATVFGRRAPPLPYVRFVTDVQRLRTGQLFAGLARKLHQHGAEPTSWGGMEMFMQNEIAPDSPLRENVYRNFQINLDDIVRAGLGCGAKVLLNTVAVNLKNCPPFASRHEAGLSPADRAHFDLLFTNGLQAAAQHDFAGAEKSYAQAAQLDAKYAALQYQWGQCLLAQTNLTAARQHLQLACDDDALPFRTDSRLNNLITQEAQKAGRRHLVLFDASAALTAENPDDLCGTETFYEHVHFDFEGSYRLGLAWAQQVAKMLPPGLRQQAGWLSKAECELRLGLSDWNRATIWDLMARRLQMPPFTSQPGDAERVAALDARIRKLRTHMDTNDAAQARKNFQTQLDGQPDDFELRENFALFLQATGDLPGAIAEWRRVHELIPQDYLPYFQLGRFLSGSGDWAEAEADLRTAIQIRPSLTDGWFELGNVLAAQGKYAEALANYAVAREQQPQNAEMILRIGKVHALLNQHAEAARCFREAIQLDPAGWEPHYELGGELDAAGQLDAARDEFAAAVRLNPGYSRAHFNYGVLLAKLGQLPAAQSEFAEALRLEPGYQNARAALAKVQMLLRQQPQN